MSQQALRFTDTAVSPLEGVSSAAWREWVAAITAQPGSAALRGGALGVYCIRPRRLVEIGRATNFRRLDGKQFCDFKNGWTQERFLADPIAQFAVLVKSTRMYYDALRDGTIKRPSDMTMSGALAVLHAGGLGAIEGWPELFDETKKLYEATKGLF